MRQGEDFRPEPLSQSASSLASLGLLSLYLLLSPPGFLLPWLKIRVFKSEMLHPSPAHTWHCPFVWWLFCSLSSPPFLLISFPILSLLFGPHLTQNYLKFWMFLFELDCQTAMVCTVVQRASHKTSIWRQLQSSYINRRQNKSLYS